MKTFFATCIMLLGLTATTAGAMSFTSSGDSVLIFAFHVLKSALFFVTLK